MDARTQKEIEKIVQARLSGAYAAAMALRGALTNVARVDNGPAVHAAGQATITPFAGMLLTAKSSGIFMCSLIAQYAAAAADVVTFTVTGYSQAAAGTLITLPANAMATGINCYVDNSGAGIAPTAGEGAAHVVTAPAQTVGTAGVDLVLDFSGLCVGSNGNPVTEGLQFYVTFSVTNSVAARAISQLAMSAFEMP